MNFFKTLLASVIGVFIAMTLLMVILFAILISTSTQPEPHIQSDSVLTINLSGTIPAKATDDPFRDVFSGQPEKISLDRLKSNLEKAAADERISGIWLRINRMSTSWATLEAIHQLLNEFREESGKFIVASGSDIGMNEAAYFLATAADSIYLPPESYFELNGFSIQTSYYRDLLEKIGVEPEIRQVGAYKSATEPFLRNESSPENREQLEALLDHVNELFTTAVADRRNITADRLNELMNEIPENGVERAYEEGLIDAIAYRHDIEHSIRERLGLEEDDEIRTVSWSRYNRVTESSAGVERETGDGQIAVIYASGAILPQAITGPFDTTPTITATNVRSSLDAALEDDDIKAIVFHIDSGGGAVSTSELIHEQLKEAAKEKPVIAYLGNVAASGGYYIAMGSDFVMASPSTITGSIGIYNLMFNTQELYNDRLGIYFDSFKTHEHSDINSMSRPLTDSERDALQRSIEHGYETFLNRVANNREMSREAVHELAQGRVWTGADAYERQLVDQLGTLDDAIAVAADRADIVNYGIRTWPERKDLFELLFQSADASIRGWVQSLLPGQAEEIMQVEEMIRHYSGQHWAILPVRYTID
jgi:protease IV